MLGLVYTATVAMIEDFEPLTSGSRDGKFLTRDAALNSTFSVNVFLLIANA
jgi:hypothetical protein